MRSADPSHRRGTGLGLACAGKWGNQCYVTAQGPSAWRGAEHHKVQASSVVRADAGRRGVSQALLRDDLAVRPFACHVVTCHFDDWENSFMLSISPLTVTHGRFQTRLSRLLFCPTFHANCSFTTLPLLIRWFRYSIDMAGVQLSDSRCKQC